MSHTPGVPSSQGTHTRASTFLGVLFLASALACGDAAKSSTSDPSRGGSIPFAPMAEDFRFYSGLCTPTLRVVRTAEEWAAAWAELGAGRSPTLPLPAVDFDTDMLIVAAMGTQSSGGYVIEVEGVAEGSAPGSLHALLLETSPGPTCVTTMAITCPTAVVLVARHEGEVQFATRTVSDDCG